MNSMDGLHSAKQEAYRQVKTENRSTLFATSS